MVVSKTDDLFFAGVKGCCPGHPALPAGQSRHGLIEFPLVKPFWRIKKMIFGFDRSLFLKRYRIKIKRHSSSNNRLG
jgi:hypothetical protein